MEQSLVLRILVQSFQYIFMWGLVMFYICVVYVYSVLTAVWLFVQASLTWPDKAWEHKNRLSFLLYITIIFARPEYKMENEYKCAIYGKRNGTSASLAWYVFLLFIKGPHILLQSMLSFSQKWEARRQGFDTDRFCCSQWVCLTQIPPDLHDHGSKAFIRYCLWPFCILFHFCFSPTSFVPLW